MIDFYELLGISINATKDEIKSAYRLMAKKYHPDVNSDENANKIIRSLNEAKEILLDDNKRNEYDKSLKAIKYSKTFSNEEKETYKNVSQEHNDIYSEVYVTKWEFYVHYLKVSHDSIFIKVLKSMVCLFNLILFNIFRSIVYVVLYLFFLFDKLVNYFAILLFIIAMLFLFNLANFSFINNSVLGFSLFFFLGILVFLIKIFIVKGSSNLIAILFNLEDSIFVKIINL